MAILFIRCVNGPGDLVVKILEESKTGRVVALNSLDDLKSFIKSDEASRVELLLMEPNFSEISTQVMCRFLKESQPFQNLPLLIANNNMKEEEIAALLEAGADDYISEPGNEVELLSRVRMAQKYSAAIRHRQQRQKEIRENVSRLVSAADMVSRESQHDPLTGLYNRTYLENALDREIKRARRDERPLSVIMADIDNFKSYHKICGEEAGEFCVIKVARTISAEIKRPGDIVAHVDGDSFIVLLPDTDSLGATVMAEIIRSAVSSLRIPHPASSVAHHVTISLGVASLVPQGLNSPTAILKQASEALAAAKEGGRNRVEVAK